MLDPDKPIEFRSTNAGPIFGKPTWVPARIICKDLKGENPVVIAYDVGNREVAGTANQKGDDL